jgi:hypothetical protein
MVSSEPRHSQAVGVVTADGWNGAVSTVLATSVACLLRRTAVCVAIRGGSSQPRNAHILAQPGRHDMAPPAVVSSSGFWVSSTDSDGAIRRRFLSDFSSSV